jgi:phosphatidate cytidylyltransferase
MLMLDKELENLWLKAQPLFNDHDYLLGFGILTGILFLVTVFNRLRCNSATASNTDHKVRVILSSWWRILGFAFVSFWGGTFTMIPIFFGLTLYAIREYIGVSALGDVGGRLFSSVAFGTSLIYLSFLLKSPFLFFAAFHIYVILGVLPFLILSHRLERLPQYLAFLMGMIMLATFLSFPVAVLVFEADWIGSENKARLAVLLLIVLTEMNDVFQFTCGKLFGRRKVIPWISPNKTLAGFLGGFLLSTLAGYVLWPYFLPMNHGQAALLAGMLSLGGMLGDLVFSAVKRHRGVKDFSDLIPGHGGVIDRLDSLLVTAPIFVLFIRFLRGIYNV